MTTWGDKLQAISQASLNRLADAEFSRDAVYQICAARAAEGYDWADIRPSLPVNVKNCEAVKTLVAALTKEKVRIEWVPIRERPNELFNCLRVSWEKPAR